MSHGFVRNIQACLRAQAKKDQQLSMDSEVHYMEKQCTYRTPSNYSIGETSHQHAACHSMDSTREPLVASSSGSVLVVTKITMK
jgi:hypothetical protein